MKRTRVIISMLLALMLVLSFTLAACGGDNGSNDQPTTTPSGNTQPSGTQPSGTKPSQSQTDPTGQLTLSVTPSELSIYAGEEIEDMLFGVKASNDEAKVRISDDGDFDNETPGTYVITFEATLGDVKVTATRTIIVMNALSALAVEVRENILGENKWPGKLMTFKNEQYMELAADTELSARTGIFKNVSDQPIVLTVGGTYGCSAVIDANGVVIEGRDGANSKLVNEKYPTRTGSSATTMMIGEESVTVSSAFAKQMTIPAGGFAIVVQSNAFGTTADTDGRGFMNYNVIGTYGNVIRLFWVDTQEDLTTYVNQKPVVTGNSKILALKGEEGFDLATAVLAGLIAKDDNGTFGSEDDLQLEAKIINDGGFNINEIGTYTITLSVSDGTLTTEFTREIVVMAEGVGTLTIGDKKMNVSLDLVAVDKELESKGNYAFVIYTYGFAGTLVNDNYGTAFIIDKDGKLVRIYDGTSGKYHDAENPAGVQDGRCTPTGYVGEAFASLQEGETLLIATNLTANNAEGGSRHFLVNNKNIGVSVSGLSFNFKTTSKTISFGPDMEFTAEEGKWLYNTEVNPNQAAGLHMIIYDKNFTGTFETNEFGCVLVLDANGVLVKVYDGANLGYWTAEGKATAHFTTKTYASVAFEELQEGETMIIFPNDGGANVHRQWALDLRGVKVGAKCYIGETATLSGFTFKKED